MNKFITLGVLLALTLALLPTGSAQAGLPEAPSAAVVSVQPSFTSVTQGTTFTVDVQVDGVTNLGAFQFNMGWDASIFTVTGVANGSFLGSTGRTPVPTSPSIDNTAGTLSFVVASTGAQAGASGSGALATITMEAVGLGQSTLDLQNVTLLEPDASAIAVATVSDGTAESTTTPCDPVQINDVTSNSPVGPGEAMTFAADVDGTTPITYTWDFGGVGSGTGLDTATPTWTYDAEGDYTVTLDVENACGSDQLTLDVSVECDAVVINGITSNSPVEPGEPMTFAADVDGTAPITYDWDFGGAGSGTGLNTANPTWTYDAEGTYTVVLQVENACGSDQFELDVVVECQPAVINGVSSNSPVELGEPMNFAASVDGTAPIDYAWDFGDGGAGSGVGLDTPMPSWTYVSTGTYTVTLEVENACGSDQIDLQVSVVEDICDPAVINDVTSDSPVDLGQPMSFEADVEGDPTITYDWDFGGAGSGTDLDTPTPTWTYASTGTYTVTLNVENACGSDEFVLEGVEVIVMPTVSIQPPHSEVEPGDIFSVTVWVEDVTNLGAYEFALDWDATVFSVLDVVDGGFLGSTGREVHPVDPEIDNTTGTLTFAASSSDGDTPGPDGEGPLAVVTLEAIGEGMSPLDLHDVILTDIEAVDMEKVVVDGTAESLLPGRIFLPLVVNSYTP